MDDYLKKQTLDKLSEARSILIAVEKDSNFDGLAAGLALYSSLKKVGKIAIITAKEPSVGDARSLYAIDKIGAGGSKNDLVITVQNAVKNVDKVTYYLEADVLKIVVHALGNSNGISTTDISLSNTTPKPNLIFAIGFSSLTQLKQEITHEQKIDSSVWIVALNLGNMIQKFAQVHFDSQLSTSISQLTTRLLQNLSLPLDEDISFNLYSGIQSKTNAFSPKFVSQSTLEAVQYLLKFSPGKANLANGHLSDTASLDETKEDFRSKLPQAKPAPRTQARQIGKEEKPPTMQAPADVPLYDEFSQTPVENVEVKENLKESWLKPPKIYRGSKSFDRES